MAKHQGMALDSRWGRDQTPRGGVRASALGAESQRRRAWPHSGRDWRSQLGLLTTGRQQLPCLHFGAHRCVGDGIGAKGSVLAGEGAAGSSHQAGTAGAGTLVSDETVGPWPVRRGWRAAQGRVVGAAHGQEVRRGIAGHHLPRVSEDGRGEEAKRVDPWGRMREGVHARAQQLFSCEPP